MNLHIQDKGRENKGAHSMPLPKTFIREMSLSPLRAPEHHHGGGRLCRVRAILTQDMHAQDEGRQARGARRVPAHMTSITEMSLGPPQGSLGVIREEGSEEAGSDADEGESAPQAESSKASAAREAPSKGRKR